MPSQAQFPFNQPIVRQPSDEYVQQSQLKRFMDRYGMGTLDD
jgi:hypothetical protein